MKSITQNSSHQESYIIELYKLVSPHKWLIFTIMMLSILWALKYLYVTPPTYQSYAIIKVKKHKNNLNNQDILQNNLFTISSEGIEEEINLLQTYKTNKPVIENSNLAVQYFIEKRYKKIELYKDSPIEVTHLSNINHQLIKGPIILTPVNKDFTKGFTLATKNIKDTTIYNFNQEINSTFFSAKVVNYNEFDYPISIVINGDSRDIYEKVITKNLSVNQLDINSNLITISYKDTIPERADNYINSLIESYINQNIDKKNDKNNKILAFLNKRLAITKEQLEKSEKELESYKSKNKSVSPAIKLTNSFEKLSDIDLRLSELQLKEQLIQNLIIFIQHNKDLDAIAPTLLEFNDQTTIRLITTLQELQTEADELSIEFTDNYPKLIQVRNRISITKRKIAQNIQNLKSILASKKRNLLKQKKRYENTLTALPSKEKKLIHFQRNYDVDAKMYNYLLEKKSEHELIQVSSIPDYEIVDEAYTASKPIKPKKPMTLIIATLLGAVIGIFLALLRSFRIDKIQKPKDLTQLTQIPIYGEIPIYKDIRLTNIPISEAYRKLAMNLEFRKKEHEGTIILVSSANQGEGKTTTLVNLASVFKNSPMKSIIIDFNMYHPSLHQYFGLEQQYSGISTYLSQRDNLGNITFTTKYPNLYIITAGPTPPNPLELLLSPRLPELFHILKKEYDYIFIDTSSFSIAPEVFYLMKYADMNLIVLQENITKKASIMELERQIREKNIENIGFVLRRKPNKEKVLLQDTNKLIGYIP